MGLNNSSISSPRKWERINETSCNEVRALHIKWERITLSCLVVTALKVKKYCTLEADQQVHGLGPAGWPFGLWHKDSFIRHILGWCP